jgi:hypothetical protein
MIPGGWMGPQWGKPFLNVFDYKKKKNVLKILSTRRAQIYIEVSCSNAEMNFI